MTQTRSSLVVFLFLVMLSTGSTSNCDGMGLVLETFTGLDGSGTLADCAGGGGAGCGSCASCGDCSCGSCTSCGDCGCALTMGPVRDAIGRRQGFAGMHSGRRIDRAAQARLSASGIAFIESIIPTVASGFLSHIALPETDSSGNHNCNGNGNTGYLTASLHHVSLTPVKNCSGNPQNQLPDGQDCLEFEGYLRHRTCDNIGTCNPEGERVCIAFDGIAVVAPGGWDNIIVTSDHRGYDLDGDPNNDIDRRKDFVPIRAQFGLWADPNPRPAGFAYGGYSRLAIFDVHLPMGHSLAVGNAHAQAMTPWADTIAGNDSASSEFHSAFQEYRSDDGDSERTIAGVGVQGDFTMNNTSLRPIAEDVIWDFPWNNCCLENNANGEGARPNVYDPRQATWHPDMKEDNGSLIVDSIVDRYIATPKCSRAEDAAGNPDPSTCPNGTDYDPPSGARHARCLIHSTSAATCPVGFQSLINNHCYNTRVGGDPNSTDPKQAWSVACLEDPLGVDVHMNVGPALAAITPGVEAALDFLIAATGNGEVVANGYNVNLAGGIENVAAGIRALGHNPCVPIEMPANGPSDCPPEREFERLLNPLFYGRCVPRTPAIPVAAGIRDNAPPRVVPGRDGLSDYEGGVVVSEDFLNYALWKVWDSGATCLNVGTTLSSLASPSLLSLALLSESTKVRTFFPINLDPTNGGSAANQDRSSVSIALRPKSPPSILVEEREDPCDASDTVTAIDITLDDLRLDLSMWTDERYVRIGTIETDVHVTLGLDVGPHAASGGNCTRELASGTLGVSVLEASLDANEDARFLPDGPMLSPADFALTSGGRPKVAAGLDTIAGMVPGIVSGAVAPIQLESLVNGAISGLGSSLGLGGPLPVHVTFDSDSIQAVEEDTETFLGVYVDLDAPPPTPLVATVDTQVVVTGRTLPTSRDSFAIASETFAEGESPTLEVAMSATGPSNVDYEYSYRTTYGEWSAWQRSPYAVIAGRELFVEGDLRVFARARIAQSPASEDDTPASASFTIDVTPPMLYVTRKGNALEVQAIDLVSESLEMRAANADGTFGEWTTMPPSGIASAAGDAAVVEVRDADGNVASTSEALQGRPNAAAASGCGCGVAGSSSQSPLGTLFAAAIVGVGLARARARGSRTRRSARC